MPDSHPIIAREGWPHVLIMLGLAVLATWLLGWWSIPFWILLVFVLQFFRDPTRTVLGQTNAVVSAADGRVVLVGKARDPYLDRDALKVSVFMNVFDVHSNRAPVSGKVVKTWYHAGGYFNAALDKASAENERLAVHFRTDDGVDVTAVQIAGLIARRILCYVREGDQVAAGQRYGFIRFGSRVDLYLPTGAVPKVAMGDRTTAGLSVVAELTPGS
jgi:phosphatidylserine decarboxylase